ncbi:MAG: hypothetical protein LCH53_06040 [Bacteroidetes bacterium]|nr:hypothetical protein [Bacteroidota bacterium]
MSIPAYFPDLDTLVASPYFMSLRQTLRCTGPLHRPTGGTVMWSLSIRHPKRPLAEDISVTGSTLQDVFTKANDAWHLIVTYYHLSHAR